MTNPGRKRSQKEHRLFDVWPGGGSVVGDPASTTDGAWGADFLSGFL